MKIDIYKIRKSPSVNERNVYNDIYHKLKSEINNGTEQMNDKNAVTLILLKRSLNKDISKEEKEVISAFDILRRFSDRVDDSEDLERMKGNMKDSFERIVQKSKSKIL